MRERTLLQAKCWVFVAFVSAYWDIQRQAKRSIGIAAFNTVGAERRIRASAAVLFTQPNTLVQSCTADVSYRGVD